MDPASFAFDASQFTIDNVLSAKRIWDITNPLDVIQINGTQSNNQLRFTSNTMNSYKQFVVLDESLTFDIPQFIGSVGNQNLHGLKDPEMIILYHKDYKTVAGRLQTHRSKHSIVIV